MTRKHFDAIAEALRATNASNQTIEAMALVCAHFNTNFQYDKFLEASGYHRSVYEMIRLAEKEVTE